MNSTMNRNASVMLNFWRENRVCRIHICNARMSWGADIKQIHIATCVYVYNILYDGRQHFFVSNHSTYIYKVIIQNAHSLAQRFFRSIVWYKASDFSWMIRVFQPFIYMYIIFYLYFFFAAAAAVLSDCKPYFLFMLMSLWQDCISLSHKVRTLRCLLWAANIVRFIIYSIGINKWKCEIRIVSFARLPDDRDT